MSESAETNGAGSLAYGDLLFDQEPAGFLEAKADEIFVKRLAGGLPEKEPEMAGAKAKFFGDDRVGKASGKISFDVSKSPVDEVRAWTSSFAEHWSGDFEDVRLGKVDEFGSLVLAFEFAGQVQKAPVHFSTTAGLKRSGSDEGEEGKQLSTGFIEVARFSERSLQLVKSALELHSITHAQGNGDFAERNPATGAVEWASVGYGSIEEDVEYRERSWATQVTNADGIKRQPGRNVDRQGVHLKLLPFNLNLPDGLKARSVAVDLEDRFPFRVPIMLPKNQVLPKYKVLTLHSVKGCPHGSWSLLPATGVLGKDADDVNSPRPGRGGAFHGEGKASRGVAACGAAVAAPSGKV